jgi:hypothetical protein
MIGSFVAQPRKRKGGTEGKKNTFQRSSGEKIELWDKLHAVFLLLSHPPDGVYYWP